MVWRQKSTYNNRMKDHILLPHYIVSMDLILIQRRTISNFSNSYINTTSAQAQNSRIPFYRFPVENVISPSMRRERAANFPTEINI